MMNLLKKKKKVVQEDNPKKRINELLQQLPSSLSDIKLKDFKRLESIKEIEVESEHEVVTFLFDIIQLLTDATFDELLFDLPKADIDLLLQKVKFFLEVPKIDKSSKINWKKVDEISYGDMDILTKYHDGTLKNAEKVIKAISKSKLTEEEILEMNMQEIHTGFFFLRLELRKFIKCSLTTTKSRLKKLNKEKRLIIKPH